MAQTVLVTGVGGPAGRAAARWLEERGHRVVGTDIREVESPAGSFRLVPPALDPGFAAALLDLAVREGAALVVPTVTEELPAVARMRGSLRARGIALSSAGPAGVERANDKLRSAEGLAREGVAIPITFPGSTPPSAVAEALGFPLLSKPRFGRGGRGVRVHRGPQDLEPDGAAPGRARAGALAEVVWQQFLPGEEFDVNLYVEPDGRPAAAVVLRKTGLREGMVGNATGVERADRPDLAELALRAASALDVWGPLDVDVRLGADGRPAVLEVNARVGANVLSAPEVLMALEDAWRNGRCA
jgi:carbamoylphosphate synthase large subunit